MRYYAAAVREDGKKQRNPDAVMIKGVHLPGGDAAVMAYCHSERRGRRYADKCDMAIRALEKLVYESALFGYKASMLLRNVHETCGRMFESSRRMKGILFTVFITYKNEYFVITNSKDRIISINKDRSAELDYESGKKCDTSANKKAATVNGHSGIICLGRGKVYEEQTVLICSEAFREKLSGEETTRVLCPQMQDGMESLRDTLDDIFERIRTRGEDGACTVAALCIRK